MDLKKNAPKGEFLAYINKEEAAMLKKAGGSGKLVNGIPSFEPQGMAGEYGMGAGVGSDGKTDGQRGGPDPGRVSTFDTYKNNKLVGTDLGLMSKYGTPKQKEEANKQIAKGNTYGYSTKQNFFTKNTTRNINYRNKLAAKQIEKKKNAIRNLINKQRGQTYSPHMDTEEILEGIMGSYDFDTNTFGKYTFDKGLNKGFDFDINKLNKNMPMTGAFGLSPNKKFGDKGKLGTKYLDSTPDFTSHPSTMPSVMGQILGKVNPMNMNTLKSNLNRMNLLETMKIGGVTQSKIDDYFDKTNRRGEYGDPVYGDGDGQQPYIPIDYNTGAATVEAVEPYTNDFAYRFGTGQNVGADVLRGYVANGGRITRAGGGIMNAVPRQGYFLGSIVKGVGKAVKGVAKAAGKVLKSDVGKMAMLAGGAYLAGGYLPGGGGIGGGFANFSNLAKNALLKDRTAGFVKGNLSLGKILGLSAALPFIPGLNKVPENEDIGMAERGGRLIDPLTNEEGTPASMRANIENAKIEAGGDPVKLAALNQAYNNMLFTNLPYANYGNYAQGGRIRAEEGGLMNLGGMEKDYRAEGGFVPIGKAEKADDVPARLSVNEFVFTADAVRNAGGGDIDKGAEVMENMMKNLENGGRVSEESQGNTGAQEMFSVSERIGEVI